MKKIIIVCSAILVTVSTAVAKNFVGNQASEVIINDKQDLLMSSEQTKTSITLNADNLQQPCILSINSSGDILTAEIILDGKLIKSLNNTSEADINLSPYLSRGVNTVKIKGNYSPASSLVSIKLMGDGTSASSQTSGSGTIEYTLLIDVY